MSRGDAKEVGHDLADLGIDIYWPQIKLYEDDAPWENVQALIESIHR